MEPMHEMPKVKDIREMARELSVKNYSRMKKVDLIRSVQEAEGHEPCYGRISDCQQHDCLWMGECMTV